MGAPSIPPTAPAVPPIISQSVSIPTVLGWDSTNYPIKPFIKWIGNRAIADAGIGAEALFDMFSTARSAPGATFYVSVTGSDGNPGTIGSPFATPKKAVQAANSAGVPTKVIMDGANGRDWDYTKVMSFGGTLPAVDLAFIARNGRIRMSTLFSFSAPSLDGTYPNCYAVTNTSGLATQRVMDMRTPAISGNYLDLTNVATPAIANITPGSWCESGGIVYIRRPAGDPVVNINTRILLNSANIKLGATQCSFFMGGETTGDGFDLEGGTGGVAGGCLYSGYTSLPASRKAVVLLNSTFKYAGGVNNSANQRGVTLDALHGIFACYDCSIDDNTTDGFNLHNTAVAGALTFGLTVRCTMNNNGRYTNQSNNGWTTHETVIAISLGDISINSHGGSFRSIGTTKSFIVAAKSGDFGDIIFGGALPPTAYMTDDTAQYWLYACSDELPASGRAAYANTGSTIYITKDIFKATIGGPGTIASF